MTDDQRTELKEKLIAGEPRLLVAQHFGIREKAVARYISRLTEDERAERDRNYQPGWWRKGTKAARKAKAGAISYHLDIRDPLYVRIAAAVPRAIGRSLRDDVISDLYLAVLEGEVEEADVEKEARQFISRGYGLWESRRGLSLDTPMGPDDHRRWVDMIPDEAPLIDEVLADRSD